MRTYNFILCGFILLAIFSCKSKNQTSDLEKSSKNKFSETLYFNQEPPGLTPEVFATGLVSIPGRNENFAAFSPNGGSFYFVANDTIFYMNYKDGEWTKPDVAEFLGDNGTGKYLRVSPDGNSIIFNKNGDLYVNKKDGDHWSEPVKFSNNINSEEYECVACITADQSVFYASHREGTKGQCDIFYSKFADGEYQSPVAIETFNTFRSECNILVSPQNDFLIFTCFENEDSFGSTDMYISCQLEDGNWSEPANLGEVLNTKYADSPFSFTPDGKYFLFGRNNVIDSTDNMDIFWVDAILITEKIEQIKKESIFKSSIRHLEQNFPDDIAKIFASDVISTEKLEHSAPAFTPDGKEIYWSVIRFSNDSIFQDIMFTKLQDGKWTEPKMAPFCTGRFYEGGPVISADGNKLYIYRGLGAPPGGDARKINIICYSKTKNGWENPVTIEEGVFHSVANNGNIYFTKEKSIARIKFENGKYSEQEILDNKINNPNFQNWTPYIASNESYLIFSRVDFQGDYGELLISFYDRENDSWSDPVNLGPKINSGYQERFPGFSPDGEFFFFTRPRDGYSLDIWWVKSDEIKKL
ncbi:MAG: PD40 domain-containing protein [Prolixibacteraceae bacterium]|nr:PD40 domain-containing protein [Prolixibacteraceae bacterium]